MSKISANGSRMLYSTFLGASDIGRGIAVDGSGNAYVAGITASANFSVTANAFPSNLANAAGDSSEVVINSDNEQPSPPVVPG